MPDWESYAVETTQYRKSALRRVVTRSKDKRTGAVVGDQARRERKLGLGKKNDRATASFKPLSLSTAASGRNAHDRRSRVLL